MPSFSFLLAAASTFVSAQSSLSTVEWRTGNSRVDNLIQQLTPQEKISLVHGTNDPGDQQQAGYVVPIPRLGIPAIRLSDGEAGINVVNNATAIPVQLNVAATWSENVAYAAGAVTGKEAFALGNGVALAPRVNILRDPLTGNFWQSYSEDPFLNAKLGIQGVAGIQNEGVMANAKQIGPSSTGASSGDTNSIVDLQTLQEVYWSAPGALLSEGSAATVMCSYAQINGVPACQYQPLFVTVRDQYNSSAIFMSDWTATKTTEESIVAGLDWEMPVAEYYGNVLYESIYVAKNISETYLDRAVGRILGKYNAFGFLDGKAPEVFNVTAPLTARIEASSAKIAYDIAVKSGFLLKNKDNTLPLREKASIAVIGPNGLQYSHGTNFAERAYGFTERQLSPLEALRSRTGRSDIESAVGIDQEGTLIPASAFTNLNGTAGLSRNDSTGATRIDSTISFAGNSALPANRTYQWRGYFAAPEAGLYTISLQRAIPSPGGKINADYSYTFAIGSLSINGTEVAQGYRLLGDGGVKPWSNSIATREGWDNIKATVSLDIGQHEIDFTIVGLLQHGVELKLCWVTPSKREANIRAAVAMAEKVDTPVVFAFANSPAQVGMTLDDGLDELMSRVAAANPKTVLVLNNAEPVLMSWLDDVAAVLEMGYAGQEGGFATVDLLLGSHNPQGRLPITYPLAVNQTVTHDPAYPGRVATVDGNATFSEGVNTGYRWYKHINAPVLFPFGYGISYTSFQYSDLRIQSVRDFEESKGYHGSWCSAARNKSSTSPEVSCAGTEKDSVFTVLFTIKNTGSRTGVEVPQVYIGPPRNAAQKYPGVQFATTSLVGFDNVEIAAGKSKTVQIGVPAKQLSFFDVKRGEFVVAQGEREVWVGKDVNDIVLNGKIRI